MMETLKGIFPHIPPPPRRDFLRENVAKIKTVQPRRVRKPSNQTEYSRFNNNNNNKPKKKFHGSSTSISTCSTKAPMMNNLRKSMSTLSLHSRDFGVQTTDPDDEYFLKDSIIRYPSASTVRSVATTSTHQLHCSRGHQLEQQRPQTPERPRRQLSEKMDRHLSNLSEFLDQGSIAKKSKSILKNSVKSNKNLINESQQKKHDRTSGRGDSEKDDVIEFVDLTATDDVEDVMKHEEELKRMEALKRAEADPDCPEGHVPLLEPERLEALKLAQHRKLPKLNSFRIRFPINFSFTRHFLQVSKSLSMNWIDYRWLLRHFVYVIAKLKLKRSLEQSKPISECSQSLKSMWSSTDDEGFFLRTEFVPEKLFCH